MTRADEIRGQIEALRLLRDNAESKKRREREGRWEIQDKRDKYQAQLDAIERAEAIDDAVIKTYDFRIAEFEAELLKLEPPKPEPKPKGLVEKTAAKAAAAVRATTAKKPVAPKSSAGSGQDKKADK